MKNIPKKIYLQIGGSDVTIDKSTTDWNDLFHGAITWADHRINDNDIEFVLPDVVEHEVKLCRFCKVGDTNNDFGCTNPKCKMYPFQ